jgi:hypothetical protein
MGRLQISPRLACLDGDERQQRRADQDLAAVHLERTRSDYNLQSLPHQREGALGHTHGQKEHDAHQDRRPDPRPIRFAFLA